VFYYQTVKSTWIVAIQYEVVHNFISLHGDGGWGSFLLKGKLMTFGGCVCVCEWRGTNFKWEGTKIVYVGRRVLGSMAYVLANN